MLRRTGHVARMEEYRNAFGVLVGKPEGKRRLGRPKRTWEDNTKMNLREVGCYPRARVRKSDTLCPCSVMYLLPLLPSTMSGWRLMYVFWAQRSTARCADNTRCTQTRVYSARGKYIVRHWTSREAWLRQSSGWGTWGVSPQYCDLRTRVLEIG